MGGIVRGNDRCGRIVGITGQYFYFNLFFKRDWLVCVGLGALVVAVHGLFVRGIWIKNAYDEKTFTYL
jgi:hypothetical protein